MNWPSAKVKVLSPSPGTYHFVTAHGKTNLGAVAGVNQELVEPVIFGRGSGHDQIVGFQPMGKFAKLRAFVQSDMGLVHHQPDLQALCAGTRNKRRKRAGIVITVRVVALGA